MRLCLPVQPRLQGGGNYFLVNLQRYLEDREIACTSDLAGRYDVLFTTHWQVEAPDLWRGLKANPGARIVHRINGSGQDYGRSDGRRVDAIQREANRLADLTIFQSHYSRRTTRETFPVIEHDGPVIHNPVDVDLFRPEGERLPRQAGDWPQLISVTWSINPKKGAASVYQVARSHPHVHILLAGRFPDAPALTNLHVLGVLGRADLAQAMRSCDALLTFSENEACPNIVLEGLASGLPILYKDSGATAELVGDCGAAIEAETFKAGLDRVMARRAELAAAARERATAQFLPEVVFGRYLAEIQAAIERPTNIPERERATLARRYRPPLGWQLRRWRDRLRAALAPAGRA